MRKILLLFVLILLVGCSEQSIKLAACTKYCSGDSYEIPAVRAEIYSSCKEAYYYGGMETLDNLIEDCKS